MYIVALVGIDPIQTVPVPSSGPSLSVRMYVGSTTVLSASTSKVVERFWYPVFTRDRFLVPAVRFVTYRLVRPWSTPSMYIVAFVGIDPIQTVPFSGEAKRIVPP